MFDALAVEYEDLVVLSAVNARVAVTHVVVSGPIEAIGVEDVVEVVRGVAARKQYRYDRALVALEVGLDTAGHLKEMTPRT